MRLAILGTIDVVVVGACYWGAYVLRLDDLSIERFRGSFLRTLPLYVGLHLLVFTWIGMYRQVWRYANYHSAILIGKSITLATWLS